MKRKGSQSAGRASAVLLGLSIILVALGWQARHSIPRGTRTRHFQFAYLVHIPKLPHGSRLLRLWIPVPQSDGHQEITRLHIGSPVAYKLQREAEYGNRYVYLEVDARRAPTPCEVRLQFEIKRHEHRVTLMPGSPFAPSTDDHRPELTRLLKPDRLVPIDGVIAALAQQQVQGMEDSLEKARKIYNYVVSTMHYDKAGEGWGRGDAIYACSTRRGNCTDFHALLIGMMRAVGIPARFEIGFSIPSGQRSGPIAGYHCWAQFYLEGLGWIPVDASEAWKNPSLRDYFLGAHDENRVLFTVGRDIRLNPAQQSEPLNYFIYPFAELDGKVYPQFETRFSFRDL